VGGGGQPYNPGEVSIRVRSIVLMSVVAAAVVFLVVQDRITAAGVREYVTRHQGAEIGQTPSVTIDEVMRPAVRRSVRVGALWGTVVLASGLATAAAVRRVERRRG
jgi:hypothetical protein